MPGPTVDAVPAGAPEEPSAWRRRYVARLLIGDLLAGVVAAGIGYLARFGAQTALHGNQVGSAWLAIALPLVWLAAMALGRTYEQAFLWMGTEEYRRVFVSAAVLLAVLGAVCWALDLQVARGLVVVLLPAAALLTLGARYAHRHWLHRQHARGRLQSTMLIVGHVSGVAALQTQLRREAYHGYRVVGCCLPPVTATRTAVAGGLPVLGSFDDVIDVVERLGIDTVAVLPSPEFEGAALRRLGWSLERTSAELVLAPAVTDIVGPRVNIRPIQGLPLLRVERPELTGIRRLLKETVDRTAAALVLFFLLPLLLAVVVAVRSTSEGPALFRQERVGRDGRPFVMLKFRTMVDGADRIQPGLADGDDGNGVLFKLRSDPRTTRVGRLLRRCSVDELPQLINVLRGDMSLVGPRPPLPREVDRYGVDMHRRFLVKPGLTGLWQINGRSNLSWDDSVRMDLRYIEHWSLALDAAILWKTIAAIVRGEGAY